MQTEDIAAHHGVIHSQGSLIPSNWDPELEPYLPIMEHFSSMFSLPIPELKAAALQFANAPPMVSKDCPSTDEFTTTFQHVTVGDGAKVELQVYTPKNLDGLAPLFFVMHGGGWTTGSHGVEEEMNRLACVKNGCVVVSVDYRMAPEHPFPYPVTDSFDALEWCINNANTLSINPLKIILGGSSAGGNLSAALALLARDKGLPTPASGPAPMIIGQILNIPATAHPSLWPHDKYSNDSYTENKDSPLLDSAAVLKLYDAYLPTLDPSPLANPLLATSLKGLPQALVSVGGLDPLRDQGIAYAERLKADGVEVRLDVYEGMPHGWGLLAEMTKSKLIQSRMVEWTKGVLERA